MQLHWLDQSGTPIAYGTIDPGDRKRQQTRPGAAWLIADDSGDPLGHFIIGDRAAKAVIPKDAMKSDGEH